MGRVYTFLSESDRPKHVKDILEALRLPTDAKTIRNASTQLNYYVSEGRYFFRPEPSTYGVISTGDFGTPVVEPTSGGESE